jgi:exonuclease SbcC
LHEHDEGIRTAARLRAESEARRQHLTGLRDQVRAAEEETDAQAVRRSDAEAEVERRRQHVEKCERARAELPGLRSAHEEARRLHRLRRDHDAATGEIERLGSRRADLREAAQDARQLLLDLREARLAGMAAELADGLAEGCACPVCGATEHPDLAQASGRVAAEDLDLAEEQAEATAAALERASLALAAAEAAQEARSAQLPLGGAGEGAALDDRVTNARAAMHSAQRLADDVPVAVAALTKASTAMTTAAAADDTMRERLAGLKATLGEVERSRTEGTAALAALLQAHADACPCWAGFRAAHAGIPSPDERHQAATEAAGATAAAEEALARASGLEAAAAGAARGALSRSGFKTPEEAAAAALDESTMAALERLCREHDESRIGFEATLDDPDVAAAEAMPAPDLAGLDAAARHAQSAHVSARSEQALAERTLRDVSRLRDRIEARCAAYLPALRRSALLRDLADTVAGTGPNNTRRMRLSSFVLAARLENVARLANERLAVMGEGRYRLQHSDELAARGARSGLGLEVLDLWTGQSRATSTLSGGEAFMASLALALGLADAVREEAGGFDLQTLFIDEGFGTLDDESLEQVLGVLDELREGGRAVGVVRSRIGSQIVVRKTAHGSSVTVRGGRGAAA